MRFTVVTNAFNQEPFLAEAVESVLAQDWPDLEYFVVDPGSRDGTAAVINALRARFPQRFTVLHERDDGPADGLNRAFAHGTGEWFYYLNGDDFLLPGAFDTMAKLIAQNPGAGAIAASGYVVDIDGRPMRRFYSRPISAARAARVQAPTFQQGTFYRADAYRAVGGFNAANKTSWDGEILLDVLRMDERVVTSDKLVAAFRIHATSITGSQTNRAEFQADCDRLFCKHYARMPTAKDRAYNAAWSGLDRVIHPIRTARRVLDAWFPHRLQPFVRPATVDR